MMKFYQEALSESAKALLNSEAQVHHYVTQLGELKAQRLTEQIIGRDYPFHFLLESRKTYNGKYEDCDYKAVHVDISVSDLRLPRSIRNNDTILYVSIVFLRNPEMILSSNLKLTDLEKKLLKNLKSYHNIEHGQNCSWFTGSQVIKLGRELAELKNNIHTVIDLSWNFSFEKLLSDNFLTNGIKARQSLTI